MPSTFTPNKKLELQGTGEHVDTWGTTLNADVFALIDQCLGNTTNIALSNAPVTLTTPQLQNLSIAFSGTLTANVTVTIPAVGGFFIFRNGTTGNFRVTIASAGGGTSQILPRSYGAFFVTDAVNVYKLDNPLGQFTDMAAAATVDIGTVVNGLVNVTGNGVTITSFAGAAQNPQSLFFVKFADTNTLSNSANLICPGGSNIVTSPNDVFLVWNAGSGVFRILGAMLASGQPLVSVASTYVPTTQTVLSGPKDSNGFPNFLPTTSGTLSLISQGLTTTPLVLTSTGGFGPTGLINNVDVISSNQTWVATANVTNFLGWDLTAHVTVVSALTPLYQFGGAISATAGQYTYDIIGSQMYLGNGSSAAAVNVVFVGEAVASASTITSAVNYAYQGKYRSAATTVLSSLGRQAFSHNIGLTSSTATIRLQNVVAEANYTPGMLAEFVILGGGGSITMQTPLVNEDRNTCSTQRSGGNIAVVDRLAATLTAITPADWRYIVDAERPF